MDRHACGLFAEHIPDMNNYIAGLRLQIRSETRPFIMAIIFYNDNKWIVLLIFDIEKSKLKIQYLIKRATKWQGTNQNPKNLYS